MLLNDNNNDAGTNNGNKGKFSERLKKIRIDRLKKRIKAASNRKDNELGFITLSRNVLKVILTMPIIIYDNVINSNVNYKKQHKKNNTDIKTGQLETDYKILNKEEQSKKIRVSKIKDIDVTWLIKKREAILNKNRINNVDIINNIGHDINIDDKKNKLQKEIIDLIKKKLVKNINELEILQSELYVLKQLGLGDIYYIECQQDIKEIKKLLSKVKSLKEKYDYLKDNMDFQYMLEYDDNFLIDKILELKDICSKDDIRHTIDDYKILNEYKYLYLKIDKLQDEIIKFENYKQNKVEELKDRDVNFEKLKNDIYDVDRESERYDKFINEQERYLNQLEDKIMQIDSYDRVTYRLKGFNQLLSNSFKYLGLLLVNPLKGLIPGIATQTLVTKNIVHNLYNNLSWEEDRRKVYEAVDYSMSINFAINNLVDTSSLIDSTLEEIVLLKNKYKKEFNKYSNSFSTYNDAIKKLNKIENAVLGSKIKIESMRIRMQEKEKQNSSKLKMVKKLNTSNNN